MNQQYYSQYYKQPGTRKKKKTGCCFCFFPFLLITLIISIILLVYFYIPGKTNIILLGIDYTEPGNSVARSDTIVLTTFESLPPYVGLLSIPRDLWVSIPGVGENRINTAHFFAEASSPGSGPYASINTIRVNFNIDMDYYIRINFDGFRNMISAMGGLDIYLPEPMAGYDAGWHHFTGRKALAFTRNRRGSDDFYRMQRGQMVIDAVIKQMMKPSKWIYFPGIITAAQSSITTNIPSWLLPRLGMIILRTGINHIDSKIISREMTTSYITNNGADVLLPNWAVILPVAQKMFAK